MKLGKALEKRKVAPHLFESDKQARKALTKYLSERSEQEKEKEKQKEEAVETNVVQFSNSN